MVNTKKRKIDKNKDQEFRNLMKNYGKNGTVKAMPILYNDLDDRFYDDSDLSLYDDYEEDSDEHL